MMARVPAATASRDAVALQKTRSMRRLRGFRILTELPALLLPVQRRPLHRLARDGLTIVRCYVTDPEIDALLADINGFPSRVGPPARRTTDRGAASASDGRREEIDRCPHALDARRPVGCAMDETRTGSATRLLLRRRSRSRAIRSTNARRRRRVALRPIGCETDRDGDGNCDVDQSRHAMGSGFGSGCDRLRHTGWVNELGYTALVLDWFREPAYHAVMGFYGLTPTARCLTRGYFPLPTDAIYPWAARSVIRPASFCRCGDARHARRAAAGAVRRAPFCRSPPLRRRGDAELVACGAPCWWADGGDRWS
jgi:hypothetical protein